MLHMTKKLHGTVNIFVLNSDLFVLQVLVDIKKNGLFVYTLIKKTWYWSRQLNFKKINYHFTEKDYVAKDSIHGGIDNFPVRVIAIREEDYRMIIMSTYGKNIG